MKKFFYLCVVGLVVAASSCTKITVISCPTGEHEEECTHEPQTDTVYVLPGNSGNGDVPGGVDPDPGNGGSPGGTDPGSGGGPQPVDP